MADTPNYLVVMVTIADPAAGADLGRTVVVEGLAGCVQVIPGGLAIYRWQGQLYEEPQTQLLIKTRAALWPQLRARIKALHPDEAPEILALPVVDGLAAYLLWLDGVGPAAMTG
jgi:periplasmic divalent cation tolerance protein